MKTTSGIILALLLAACGTPLLAHGGSYRGPSFPTGPRTPGGATPGPGPGSGSPGATQGLDLRRWETWWALNKEDFFPARGVQRVALSIDPSNYAAAGPRAPSSEEMRTLAVPALLELLRTEKAPTIRDAACIALGKIGGVPEVDVLRAATTDRVRSVREGALLGLGLLREPAAEDALIGVVKDTGRPGRERGLALVALGLSGRGPAADFLRSGFAGASPLARGRGSDLESVRAFAIGLLGGNDLLPPAAPPRETPFTADLIGAIKRDGVPESDFVAQAYAALAKARDPNAWVQVRQGLRHPQSAVRAGAAIAAGRTLHDADEARALELQALLAEESDSFAKRMLVVSMGRIGGARMRRILAPMLQDGDRQIRAFAALALGMAGAREHVPGLRALLRTAGDGRDAAACAIALGLLADTDSRPLIVEEIKRRKDPAVQALLVQALIVLQDPEAVPAIQALLVGSRNPDVQAAAGLALGLLGDGSSVATLLAILDGSRILTVQAAVAAGLGRRGDRALLAPLLAHARDTSRSDGARAFAVAAIGILGDKSPALPPFARTAIDAHYGVRNEVLEELRDIL